MGAVYPMVYSGRRRGPKLPTTKSLAPTDLANRFLELQRLRKRVHELEQLDEGQRNALPPGRTKRGAENDGKGR
jgi:hypothetical protein